MINLLLSFNLLLGQAESSCDHECTTPANPACPSSWIDGIPNGEETALPLVDSLFIDCMEMKCLHLYLPQDTDCNIEGQSGITISTGVDLRYQTEEGLVSARVSQTLVDKLKPYLGKSENLKQLMEEQPLTLDDTEATELGDAVKTTIRDELKTNYDAYTDGPKFSELQRGIRTAIASVYYQYGWTWIKDFSFWEYVTHHDRFNWRRAIGELNDFEDPYPTRRHKERDILAAALLTCDTPYHDICLILDQSISIDDADFEQMRQFIINLVNGFLVGPKETQIALITYSDSANLHFDLETYSNKTDIVSYIQNFPRGYGYTYTDDALRMATEQIFNPENGMRDESLGFSPLTVVITDGQSTDEDATATEALRLQEISKVMAVGVGDLRSTVELNAIASDPRFIYNIADFDALLDSSKEMLGQICYVPIVTKSDVTYSTTTKSNGYKYFEVNFQADIGVTIKIKVKEGDVVIFGSHTLPIPTEHLYQVKAERSGDKNMRIWDIERRRLTTGNSTAYFRLKGLRTSIARLR